MNLKNTDNIEVRNVQGGSFCYFGIQKSIYNIISKNDFNDETIFLQVNIDGLPIFKSSSLQLWPVLARFSDFEPFVIALYGGKEKPRPDALLGEFVEELVDLQQSEIKVHGKLFSYGNHGSIAD